MPLRNLRIYLDTCCVNRLFDAGTQTRVHLEAEAVTQIITYFDNGLLHWIASEILIFEVSNNPNVRQRGDIIDLLQRASQTVSIGTIERFRCVQLEALKFKRQDALHIACAESGGADVLLTTDDKLLRRATRFRTQLHVRVENPHIWLQEETNVEN